MSAMRFTLGPVACALCVGVWGCADPPPPVDLCDTPCPTGSVCTIVDDSAVCIDVRCVDAVDETPCAAGAVCRRGACVAVGCGDGVVSDGEACEPPEAGCTNDCRFVVCGDGIVDVTEGCDGDLDCDGCDQVCGFDAFDCDAEPENGCECLSTTLPTSGFVAGVDGDSIAVTNNQGVTLVNVTASTTTLLVSAPVTSAAFGARSDGSFVVLVDRFDTQELTVIRDGVAVTREFDIVGDDFLSYTDVPVMVDDHLYATGLRSFAIGGFAFVTVVVAPDDTVAFSDGECREARTVAACGGRLMCASTEFFPDGTGLRGLRVAFVEPASGAVQDTLSFPAMTAVGCSASDLVVLNSGRAIVHPLNEARFERVLTFADGPPLPLPVAIVGHRAIAANVVVDLQRDAVARWQINGPVVAVGRGISNGSFYVPIE